LRQGRFDSATGLTDYEPRARPAPPGAGPRHFVLHPGLPFINLLKRTRRRHRRARLRCGASQLRALQTVRALPPGFAHPEPWAADIHLTPDGRFLFAVGSSRELG